jgi:hypothetical protein
MFRNKFPKPWFNKFQMPKHQVCVCVCVLLGIKLRALSMLGKCSTTELCPNPQILINLFLKFTN